MFFSGAKPPDLLFQRGLRPRRVDSPAARRECSGACLASDPALAIGACLAPNPGALLTGALPPGPRVHPKPAASDFGSRASPARTRVTFSSAKK